MKSKTVYRCLIALFVALLLVPAVGCRHDVGAEGAAGQYYCPMHPDYRSDKPGDCPICGMRLVPMEKKDAEPAGAHQHGAPSAAPASVPTSAEGFRLAGVQTAVAERQTLTRTTRAAGVVVPDETRVRHVHTKVAGYIEELYVNYTGQQVRRGQPLLSIYSPELLATQKELLRAKATADRFSGSALPEVRRGGEELLEAARERLELLDVPPGFISRLESTGQVQRTVTLTAPASGFVTGKEIFEGQEVQPGMDVLTLTDLSRVWIEADFYEYESRSLRLGQKTAVSLPYDPGVRLTGKVAFVYPVLDPQSRTIKVRLEFPNPGLALKPGMYVDVTPELETSEGVVIPDSAIIDTGVRQVVFVQKGETFEPREVRVGNRGDGQALVLSGVEAGERVAVRANFLLDSESKLRAALTSMPSRPAPEAKGGAQ